MRSVQNGKATGTVRPAAPPAVIARARIAGRAAGPRPGWTGADTAGEGWNGGDRVVSGQEATWGIHRVPIQGLKLGNQRDFSGDHLNRDRTVEHGGANERARTLESAAGRAIVLVPQAFKAGRPFTVLLHLHGHTSRSGDPYAGWRQRQSDHTVRDVDHDLIEAQLDAVNDSQLVAILAQGVGHSEYGDLMPGPYIEEVIGRLAQVAAAGRIPVPKLKKGFQLVLSAHGGGGFTVTRALRQEGRPIAKHGPAGLAPAEVILFEAINGDGDYRSVVGWVDAHLARTLAGFRAARAAGDAAGQARAIASCPVLRAYRTASPRYARRYDDLDHHLKTWFTEHQEDLGAATEELHARFRVSVLTGTSDHEATVRGLDTRAAGRPLADALNALTTPAKALPVS